MRNRLSTSSFNKNALCLRSSSLLWAASTDVDKSSSSSQSWRPSSIDNQRNYRDLEQQIVKLGRAGRTQEALDLYFSIGKHNNLRLLNGAIDACARARPPRRDTAFDIFQTSLEEYQLNPNVFTFGALMNVCNQDGNASQALQLIHSMQEQYQVAPNAVVYSSAISACARAHPPQAKDALKLLREAIEERDLVMNVVGFNAAISACAQAGDWESAISVMNRMEEANVKTKALMDQNGATPKYKIPAPDIVTYGTVLAACERGEQWELVLKYAKSAIDDQGLDLDALALTSCLHACQQLGLPEPAMQFLEAMKTAVPTPPQTAKLQQYGAKKPLQGPDAVAYKLAISACARGGAWKEGIKLLEDYSSYSGQAADVVAYTAAITGCEYAGQWREALYLLDKMRKEGVAPNEVTMAAVIGACATACARENGDLHFRQDKFNPKGKALQLLEILKIHPTLPRPNIQVYNAAIRVCAEACDIKRAFELLQEVEDIGMERTEVTYGSLITACERVGDVESLSKAFLKLKEDEIMPNEIMYGAAISCCRKAKQSERALLLLRKMMKEGLSPNAATLNTVLMAQAEGRTRADSERAVTVYKLMKSKFVQDEGRPNRQTYNILVNFFASIMKPLTAEEFLKEMRAAGLKPDVDLFTATVAAYERTRQPLKALRLMESMEADGYDFYGVKVLNAAFKKAVHLVNKVGKNFSPTDDEIAHQQERTLKLFKSEDDEDDEDDEFDDMMNN